jgi:hypothetical protein
MQQYYVDECQRTYALEANDRFQAGVSGVTLTPIDGRDVSTITASAGGGAGAGGGPGAS